MSRYVILGAGIAGFSAAETLRSLDPVAEILLVSDDPDGFYSRPGLAYYLTGRSLKSSCSFFQKKASWNLNIQTIKGVYPTWTR